MIGLISLIPMIFLLFLQKTDFFYFVYVKNVITFCIVFYTILCFFRFFLKSKLFILNNRLHVLYTFYIIEFFVAIIGLLYFKSFLSFSDIKNVFGAILTAICITFYFFLKRKELINWKSYGKVYISLQTIDLILVVSLYIFNTFYITLNNLAENQNLFLTIVVLYIVVLSLLNSYLNFKRNYWYHKKVLYAYFDIQILSNNINSMIEPLSRSVSNDFMLSEAKWLLNYSLIRPLEITKISRDLLNKLLKANYPLEKAIQFVALFCATLVVNLMRRPLDFSILPSVFKEPIQNYIRNKRFLKEE